MDRTSINEEVTGPQSTINRVPDTQETQNRNINNQSNIMEYLLDFRNDLTFNLNVFKQEFNNNLNSIRNELTIKTTGNTNNRANDELKLTSDKIKEIRYKIHNIYDKIERLNHHKNIAKTHKNNTTVPNMLSYSRYPVSFL